MTTKKDTRLCFTPGKKYGNKDDYGWPTWYYGEKDYLAPMITKERICVEELFLRSETAQYSFEKGVYRSWYENHLTNPNRNPSAFSILNAKNTNKWFEQGCPPLQCEDNTSTKKQVEALDFLDGMLGIPIVSDRAYRIMKTMCPDDFESFEITIKTKEGIIEGYRVINILKKEYNALDLNLTEMTFGRRSRWDAVNKKIIREYITREDLKRFYEDIDAGIAGYDRVDYYAYAIDYYVLKNNIMKDKCIARLAEKYSKIIFAKRLVDAFKAANLNGFLYEPFEDTVNHIHNPPQYLMEDGYDSGRFPIPLDQPGAL